MFRILLPSLLVLAASASTPVPSGAEGGVRGTTTAAPGRPAAADEVLIHRLAPGETLESIADAAFVARVHLAEARAFNRLRAGQKLPAGYPLRLKAGWIRHQRLAAEVVSFSGPSLVDVGGASTPVALGMLLTEGDRIRTSANGFVTLRLEDGSKIALPSNSRVRIDRLRRLALSGAVDRRFQLDEGKVDAKVTPLKPDGSRFLITTPVSVAAVRGTRYRVTFTPETMRATTGVVEGRVAVGTPGDIAAADGVVLNALQGTVSTETGVRQPVRLPAAPMIESVTAAPADGSLSVRFRPLAGATRYIVAVSRDAEGLDLVRESETASNRFTEKGLPAGRYHVQVMAVDPLGLAGIPTHRAVDQPVGGKSGSAKDPSQDGVASIAADPAMPGAIEEGSAFDDPATPAGNAPSPGGGSGFSGGAGPVGSGQPFVPFAASPFGSGLGGAPPGGNGGNGGNGEAPGGGEPGGSEPGGGPGGGPGGEEGGPVVVPPTDGGPGGGAPGAGAPGVGPGVPGGVPGPGSDGGPGGQEGGPVVVPPPDGGAGPGLPGGDFGGNPPGGEPAGPPGPDPGPGNGDGGTVIPNVPVEPPPAPVVPEPATWLLLLAGFGLVGHAVRRQRARQAADAAH